MYEKISIKDILAINQKFDKGNIINESSLTFALDRANNAGSWLQACAYLVRAVLIDHVFEDGNKRTAAGIVVGFFDAQGLTFHPEKIAKAVTIILMKNITSINSIEMVIKDAVV